VDPGSPPILISTRNNSSIDLEKNASRFCKWCQIVKPLGCKHCHACNKCVLKMDHHCPWINNCVGMYNLKFFFLFLFYLALTCFYTSLMCIPILVKSFSSTFPEEHIWILILTIFCFVFFFITCAFCGVTLYSVLIERTSVDLEEGRKFSRKLAKRNFEHLIGASWWWFWIPNSKTVSY